MSEKLITRSLGDESQNNILTDNVLETSTHDKVEVNIIVDKVSTNKVVKKKENSGISNTLGNIDPAHLELIKSSELRDIIRENFNNSIEDNPFLKRIPNLEYDIIFYTNNFEMFLYKYNLLRNKEDTILLNTTVPCGDLDCYRGIYTKPIQILIVDTNYKEFDSLVHKIGLFIYEGRVI